MLTLYIASSENVCQSYWRWIVAAELWDVSHIYVNNDYHFIFFHDFIESAKVTVLNLRILLYLNLASYSIEFAQVTLFNLRNLLYWICARYSIETAQVTVLNLRKLLCLTFRVKLSMVGIIIPFSKRTLVPERIYWQTFVTKPTIDSIWWFCYFDMAQKPTKSCKLPQLYNFSLVFWSSEFVKRACDMCDLRLARRCKWDQHSSGALRSVDW
jgi:hypothetical protein